MAYKFSTGSVRRGDVYYEDDRTGEPTYIDFGQDTITLRPSGSQILYAQPDAIGIGTTSPNFTLHVAGEIGVDQYIRHNGNPNTHINFTEDKILLKAGNKAMITMEEKGTPPHEVTINDGGNNIDFVVEDNSGNNLLMTDASTSMVGIKTGTPIAELDVAGKIAITAESSTPGTPADGQGYIYSKSDGKLYWKSYDLAETDLTATGGGGGGGTPGGSDSMVQYNDGGSFNGAQGLVYDDSNTRVGIGIMAPLATLHVHSDTINNGIAVISQADNSGDASQLDLSKARGSGASPATVQSSDFIGQVRMLGYDGDSYDNFADIYVQAAGTVSTTSHPSKMVIRTTQAGATSPTTAITIDESQNMTVNGNIYGKMLHMTHHRYNDGSGKTKEYIPWAGTSEQPSPSWISQGVAPYAGKLLKVLLRQDPAGSDPVMGSTTVGIHTATDGNALVSAVAEETETVNMSSANTTYTFNFTDTTHFGPGDIIAVSIDPTEEHGNVTVTCVWEYDITA